MPICSPCERTAGSEPKKLRSEIGVDDVRAVSAFLRLTPAEGGWRVVVVDRADELNRNAANALLKILEEPPARALLLLVCASPGSAAYHVAQPLPPSRACARLPDADMARLLALYLPEVAEDERARLIALAEGSPGRALLLRDDAGPRARRPRRSGARGAAGGAGRGRGMSPTGWGAPMAGSRPSWTCCAPPSPPPCALPRGVRPIPSKRGSPRCIPLMPGRDVWHALTRLQDETERFALDRRQAVLSGLRLLAEPSQGTA